MQKYTVFEIWLVVCLLALFMLQPAARATGTNVRVTENISLLKKTKACPGCDLKGAVLNRMDLSGANLEGADLTDAKFFLANLAGANLKNAHLQGAVFGGTDLAGADLRGADLRGADITTAYLVGVKMDGKLLPPRPSEEAGESETKTTTAIASSEKKTAAEPVTMDSNEKVETRQNTNGDEKNVAETPADTTAPPVKTAKSIKEVTVETAMGSSAGTEEGAADNTTTEVRQKSNGNEKTVAGTPADTTAPPVKTVEPIKNTAVETAKSPSAGTVEEDAGKGVERLSTGESNEKPGNAGSAEEMKKKEITKKTEPELTVAVADATPSQSTTVSSKEQDSSAAPRQQVGNESKDTTVKPGGEEPASQVLPKPDQTIIEKDITPDKKTAAEQSPGEPVVQKEEIKGDKAKNLKRLLDTGQCYHCDLSGLDLSGKNLGKADLEGANLTGSNLEKSDLGGAILKGAILVDANLKKTNLSGADLYKADFTGADLTDSDMKDAKIEETTFTGAGGMHR